MVSPTAPPAASGSAIRIVNVLDPALAAAFTELARDAHASVPEAELDDLIRQGLITQGEGGSRRVRYRLYERLLQAEAQPPSARRKVRVFYSYAREDEGLRERLAVHLKLLERQGLIDSKWRVTENNRRARYYAITAAGRRHLKLDEQSWQRMSRAINLVLAAAGGER